MNISPPTRTYTSIASLGRVTKPQWRRLNWDAECAGDYAIVALTDRRLPKPDERLEAYQYVVPGEFPLLVIAARELDTCYYFTVNLADAATRRAFAEYFNWEVELIFLDDYGRTFVHLMDFSAEDCKQIRAALASHADTRREVPTWMIPLEALADSFVQRFAELEPGAARCGRHCIVLLDGDKHRHAAVLARAGAYEPEGA